MISNDCECSFTENNKTCIHHDHTTGNDINSIFNKCNLQYKNSYQFIFIIKKGMMVIFVNPNWELMVIQKILTPVYVYFEMRFIDTLGILTCFFRNINT